MAGGVSYPTTDYAAFWQADLYIDRTDASCNFDHWTTAYPDSLDDLHLLIVRNYADTIAVCSSFATEPMLIRFSEGQCSNPYLTFGVNPPRRATDLYLLSMAEAVFPDDAGLRLVVVRLESEDGPVFEDSLSAGEYYRNIVKHDCERDMLLARPTDHLSGEVWSAETAIGDSLYFDVQMLKLPESWWEEKVSEISLTLLFNENCCIESGEESVGCINEVTTALLTSGISLGTDFRVTNSSGDSVEVQHQFGTWSDEPYGGYWLGGELYGEGFTLRKQACFLTCAAMVSTFYGQSFDPSTLNSWLQNNKGYARTKGATVVGVQGQAVGDTVRVDVAGDEKFKVGQPILVENGAYSPIATLVFLEDGPGGAANVLTVIDETYAGAIAEGDEAFAYFYADPGKLSESSGYSYAVSSSNEPAEARPRRSS